MDIRFPMFITLTDNNCTVIGGGEYAAACTEMLLKFGAKVTVISPTICPALEEWDRQGRIRYIPRKFFRGDCANAYLCVAATDSETVNIAVSVECKSRHIPVNVKTPAVYGTFQMPLPIVHTDWVIAACGANHTPPVVVENLCDQLEEELPAMWREACESNESI